MRCTESELQDKKERKTYDAEKVVTNRWSWLTTVKESLASVRASYGTRW